MKRILLFFSYIGSGFRGLQRQIPRGVKTLNAVPCVAEVIESCIQKVLQLDRIPVLYTASRTDAGVHALKSAAHIDLDIPASSIDGLVAGANYLFSSTFCPIRIISAQIVKEDFNSRALPIRRHYLYRFAVRKLNLKFDDLDVNRNFVTPIPITEYLRCHFIGNSNFNIDAVNEVLPLFREVNDFRTFMGSLSTSGKQKYIHEKDVVTVRKLDSIEISPGQPFLPSPLDDNFNYYDFTCSSKSFLYKQVRRMVSAIINVANGTLTYNDIKYMFDNPSSSSWDPRCRSAPPYGLYLTDVEYDEEDLVAPVYEVIKSSDLKTSPKDVVGLTVNEKINLRLQKLKLETSEAISERKN